MKLTLSTLLILLISIGNSIAQTSESTKTVVVFTNATVIDGMGATPMENATILIEDERIACVGECEIPDGAKVIDARGKYIIPGLVDAHVHYDGSGWFDTRPGFMGFNVNDRFPIAEVGAEQREYPERFHRSYLCSGVTAVFDIGGQPWTLDVRDDAKGSKAAPHIASAGPMLTTMPYLEPDARALNIHMVDEESVRFGVRVLSWLGSDAVKIVLESGPKDREAVRSLLRVVAEEANRAGLPVIAHASGLENAKDALWEGNASMLAHPVLPERVDDEFLELARRNDAVYVTHNGRQKTILAALSMVNPNRAIFRFPEQEIPLDCVDPVTRSKLRLTESLPTPETNVEVVDSYRAELESEYSRILENLKRVHEAGITVAIGSDAGNPLTVHGPAIFMEMEGLAKAGLTPMEVLVASTRNGAKAMGRLDEFGTLEVGKIADMVVLEKNPLEDISNVRSIELVVRGGKVWTREELEYE